jgi:hypothetical protein
VKDDVEVADNLARIGLLQQEQQNKWTCQDKLMLV